MEANNGITAPQLIDTMDSVFRKWKATGFGEVGTMDDFFRFMTTPSVQRDRFLSILKEDCKFDECVAICNYQ